MIPELRGRYRNSTDVCIDGRSQLSLPDGCKHCELLTHLRKRLPEVLLVLARMVGIDE